MGVQQAIMGLMLGLRPDGCQGWITTMVTAAAAATAARTIGSRFCGGHESSGRDGASCAGSLLTRHDATLVS